MVPTIEEAAQVYLSSGLSVIPAKDKRPALSTWKPYQRKPMERKAALAAFAGAAQIALICGAVSGRVEVVDIDLKYDISGTLYPRFKQLLEEACPDLFYKLVIQSTKGRGCHLVYRCETIGGNQKLAQRPTTEEERVDTRRKVRAAEMAKGKGENEAYLLADKAAQADNVRVLIETRGEGGYIICAPSEGYRVMSAADLSEIPLITVEERATLLSVCQSLNEYAPPSLTKEAPTEGGWELSPGDDYDQRGDLEALLVKHGWTVTGRIDDTVRFLRPGETTSAYSANYNQIPGRFWVWSTSTMFTPETPYKPYAVYAMLECKGDFKEAAKKLLAEGYGKSKPLDRSKAAPKAEVQPEAPAGDSIGAYIRVGTTYYKKIQITDLRGNQLSKIVRWSKEEIILDFGKKAARSIPKYDSFVMRPAHEGYQSEIGRSYNIYNQITHELIQGAHPHVDRFIQHVFGDKATLFWDYLTILWRHPTQVLPVLCLVSEQRQTGKTTVFELLRAIFQSNAVILKNENFQTQFNAHFVGKLLLMIDENYVDIDKKKESERIKSMATARTEWLQFKGKDSEAVDYYGKILMTANNKEFIKIDREEIRYMVVEVPKFERNDPDLLEKMIEEIPALLFTLQTRQIHYPREDRAWFRPELLYTETLSEVVQNTRTKTEELIDTFIEECIEAFCVEDREEIFMTAADIYSELEHQTRNLDRVTIMRHLKRLGYKTGKLTSYHLYRLSKYHEGAEAAYCTTSRIGRPYRFTRPPQD
jgi:hypothetical protein